MSPRVSEVAEASLEIRNVNAFLFLMNNELRRKKYHLKFGCGKTIGIPAHWEFYMEYDEWRNVLKAVVELDEGFEAPEDLKVIKTAFEIDLKAGDQRIKTFSSGPRIFRPKATNKGKECWEAKKILGGVKGLKWLIDERGDGGKRLTVDLRMTVHNDCYRPVPVEEDEGDDEVTVEGAALASSPSPSPPTELYYSALEDLEETMNEADDTDQKPSTSRRPSQNDLQNLATVFSEAAVAAAKDREEGISDKLAAEGLQVILKYMWCRKLPPNWHQKAVDILRAFVQFDDKLQELMSFFDANLLQAVTEENVGELYRLAERFCLQDAADAIIAKYGVLHVTKKLERLTLDKNSE